MVTQYSPAERAARRRRSSQSQRSSLSSRLDLLSRPAVDTVEDDASWIADLRAQGVDVDEFLKAAQPPDVVNFDPGVSEPGVGKLQRRRSSLSEKSFDVSGLVRPRPKPRRLTQGEQEEKSKLRFSQFLDQSYVFDESVGDMVMNSFEDVSRKTWLKEVEEDSKNFNPDATCKEKLEQSKAWALKKALERVTEAGYTPAHDSPQGSSEDNPTYTKVRPPPIEPLPQLSEEDFDITEPPLNPRELGIFPPSLPHQLVDLVPKVSRSVEGIVDGFVVHGTHEELWETCDSETMIASCIKDDCASYLRCSRGSSLVRCEDCGTVSPACPVRGAERVSKLDDILEGVRGLEDFVQSEI